MILLGPGLGPSSVETTPEKISSRYAFPRGWELGFIGGGKSRPPSESKRQPSVLLCVLYLTCDYIVIHATFLSLFIFLNPVDPSVLRSLSPKKASTTKSLQSCPTLCDPIDGSPPGSPVPGILQARTLEWVAISLSNA